MGLKLPFLEDPRWQVRGLLLAVSLSLLCLLPGIAKYHGDECFYTDAAIRMSQTGDYLTPYAANGALRFAKPILPYWAVLAGYSVFGVSFLGSRIVFMLAGCSVIALTYRLCLKLFGRPKEAALAALIMGSNVQLLTISLRSTPDALLCLFVLLSLVGFAQLIFSDQPSWRDYGLAYIGAALAVETRGLPGLGVAVYPFVYCLIFRRRQTRLRDLIEWKALVLGLIVAGAWFGAMLWLHGQALIDGFYYDQVTENIRTYVFLDSLSNLWAYGTGVLRHFLPWSALLLLGLWIDRRTGAAAWNEHRSKCWFLLGWFLFIVTPFIFGDSHRTRYMSVAYPFLSILLALMLARYEAVDRFRDWTIKIIASAAMVLGLAGLLLLVAGAIAHGRLAAGGLLLIAASGTAGMILRRKAYWALTLALALLPLACFWCVEFFWRPVFSQSPAPALVATLDLDPGTRTRVYALNMSPSYQAQIRVLSEGRLTVVPLAADAQTPLLAGTTPLVFAGTERALVPHFPEKLDPTAYASSRWRARDFMEWLDSNQRVAVTQRHLIPYYVLRSGAMIDRPH